MQPEPESPLRDRLAVERTRLANERTLLSYMRTSLALLAGGVTLIKFFDGTWSNVLGVASCAIGVLVGVLGLAKFVQVARRLGRG